MKNKKVAIIGANGQLGNDLCKILSEESALTVFPLTHNDIEISNEISIEKVFSNIQPDIIINTAAYNKVDEIENNTEKAFLINAIANKYLADYCNQKKSTFVYISTDYVFGNDQKRNTSYKESDCPGPINAYGISKLAGEYFAAHTARHFIIRTCGLFGKSNSSGKKTNFIESLLKIAKEKGEVKVVNDQYTSPTYTLDLAKQILTLIKTDAFGLYHATSKGNCSWYEFAKEIFSLTKTTAKLEGISYSSLLRAAKRPRYSVLESYNLTKLGINNMRHWKEGLKDYLIERETNS